MSALHFSKLDPRKQDAIHRALLAGLLSNVGKKTDPHEYTGARGGKFNIHPGSALFRKDPPWLMAAEIVETTRRYARTNARIQVEWVERLAEHLLKRTYSDPHWNPATAHVNAYEKVTLYGLVLVPSRPVHYGPIDPKVSRELFITHALVEGEYRTDAPFFRHNAKLIDEVQHLEAKSRSRDVLVDSRTRYDFYDARIPAGIHNGPLFEKWRREIERHNAKLLFMTRRDLMQHAADGVTAEMFPDHLTVAGITLPLEYHFEVGHIADGVTATIPLPVLSQLPTEPFEWLVPGLLKEKMVALIKSLPKELRVNFVPAPDYAEQAYRTLKPYEGSLTDSLAAYLSKLKGASVPRGAFDPSSLLDHLHFNFRVVDQAGKQLAMGRSLEAIRRQLGVRVRETFSSLHHPLYHRDHITRWDFGDLPESVTIQRHGLNLTAYPALTATPAAPAAPGAPAGSVVSLRLFESRESAQAAHIEGLRRLIQLQLKDELQYLASSLPDFGQMALHYSLLGPGDQLKRDLIGETLNRAFLFDANVRSQMEFELRLQAGRRHRLLEVAREVASLAAQILGAYHEASLLLSRPVIPAFAEAVADVRRQIAELMPRDFLTTTPDDWLAQYPRFLEAIALRLGKLSSTGHSRDKQRMMEIRPFIDLYQYQREKNRQQNILDPALDQFRWMIEELRVSLFAQELKTSIPISPKRLEKQWESVRK